MNKEEFIDSNMKLSKEDIIYNYHETEEKLIEKLGIEHENNKLKIQIGSREKLINTILNFSLFKEECPLNLVFEDNSKEEEAQNIFYNDEYCANHCNDIYKDCWLKYFKELQKIKGDVKNENNNV